MGRYDLPKRVFMHEEKKPVTLRVPNDLKLALEGIAREKGRSFTDLVLTVLDQFAQQETVTKKLNKV